MATKEIETLVFDEPNKLRESLGAVVTDEVMEIIKGQAAREHTPFVNPQWSHPIFWVGMEILRYNTPSLFSEIYDYSLPANYETGSVLGLLQHLEAYAVKLFALKHSASKLDGSDEKIVVIDPTLIEEAEREFRKIDVERIIAEYVNFDDSESNREGRGSKVVTLYPERETRRKFCEGVISQLRNSVLPAIERAAKPIIEADRYVMGLVKKATSYKFHLDVEGCMERIRQLPKNPLEKVDFFAGISTYLRTIPLEPLEVLSAESETGVDFNVTSREHPELRDPSSLYTKDSVIVTKLTDLGYLNASGITLINFYMESQITTKLDNGNYSTKISFRQAPLSE